MIIRIINWRHDDVDKIIILTRTIILISTIALMAMIYKWYQIYLCIVVIIPLEICAVVEEIRDAVWYVDGCWCFFVVVFVVCCCCCRWFSWCCAWLFPKETAFRFGRSYIHSLVPVSWAPLGTRVWFHVLDCKITDVFCHFGSVGLEWGLQPLLVISLILPGCCFGFILIVVLIT